MELLDSIITLQPQQVATKGKLSPEEQTLNLIAELSDKVPIPMNVTTIKQK